MAHQYSNHIFEAGEPDLGTLRKNYTSPALLEYGNVAKLTRGSSGSMTDGGGMGAMDGNLSAPRDRNAPAKMR